MNRLEFLKKMGLGGGALLAVYCTGGTLGGCKKKSAVPQSSNQDFTLDLTNASYSNLKNNGSYVVVNSVVVAKTTTGNYVAVTQICSHQGQSNVVYVQSSNIFYCSSHGAEFDTTGKGLNSNGSGGLKTYNAVLTGNSLHIYS